MGETVRAIACYETGSAGAITPHTNFEEVDIAVRRYVELSISFDKLTLVKLGQRGLAL
jgi:hypothetical protein